MLFPWVGMFEQIRLADVYVHYVDVQFSKGSFVNRVQIKTSNGFDWLTIPLRGFKLGQHINQVIVDNSRDWRRSHIDFLTQALSGAPYIDEMLEIVESVYSKSYTNLVDIVVESIHAVCTYFELDRKVTFLQSPQLNIGGSSSQRVLDTVMCLKGGAYITGHGAKNYLDHEIFENAGIRVEYMDYRKTPYPQLHGPFTPYVSILDLIANMGKDGKKIIHSDSVYWKDFL